MQSRNQSRGSEEPNDSQVRESRVRVLEILVTPLREGLSPYYRYCIASLRELGELRVSKMSARTL